MANKKRDPYHLLGASAPGLSVGCGLLTGGLGLGAALLAFGNGDAVGGGICLLAAAVASGLLAQAFFRR